MKAEDFITGEIYNYCNVEYCYLGFEQNNGDLVFCLEQNPKYQVVLGKETFYVNLARKPHPLGWG